MTIEIRQEQQGEVRILALSGRLDTETSADLELALQDLQADGATHFVIDLADIGPPPAAPSKRKKRRKK